MIVQRLPNRYIAKGDLVRLLKRLFGGNYEVEDNPDDYVISVPRMLTDVDELPFLHSDAFYRARHRTRLNPLREHDPPEILDMFKETVTRCLRKNIDNEIYLPQGALSGALSEEVVKQILLETSLERSQIEELTQSVLPGALKVFTILLLIGRLECIVSFIEDDQMQPADLDQKLPLPLQKLLALLDDEGAAVQFYGQQWTFTAPVFNRSSLPRILEKKTIMPFTESKCEGKGGFGEVYQVQIDPNHHSFAHPGHHRFARKVLKVAAATRLDYEVELRNLSILRLLKHPCLVDLLACFTYRERYNFIFPLADGGSLADLFSGKRPSPFRSSEEIFTALCGLISAVRAVHDYFAEGIETIGCHRDLKPSNILLNGTTMLLADFGLCRFKQVEDGSASYFRAGRGDYLAPECEDLDELFEKHIIRRSSDIWSLGCILSEIMTFILTGVGGVQQFRSSRRFKKDGVVYYRFHQGPNAVNQGVWESLDALVLDHNQHARRLLPIIKELLVLDSSERPRISTIDIRMRRFALGALTDPLVSSYGELCENNSSIPAFIEAQRFRAWKTVLQDTTQTNVSSFLSTKSYEDFTTIITSLKELKLILQATISELQTLKARTFLPLRKINDSLYDVLPPEWVSSAKLYFECLLLESEDTTHLLELSESLYQNSRGGVEGHIGQLAAVKRLKLLIDTGSKIGNSPPSLDSEAIETVGWLEFSYLGWLKQSNGDSTKHSVIVEVKNYDEHYSIAKIASELFARLDKAISLLNTARSFRVLPCLGYYHDPSRYSLGLVYQCPVAHQPGKSTVSTLHGILEKAADEKGSKRPSLGHRFQLAHSLASSVLEFHKVNWVQKAISSFNIIFFKAPDVSWKTHMTGPFFLGYLNSRQDDEGAFTEGPADDDRLRLYLCPEYLEDSTRYKQHFDYYSLGLVLLELGYWRTLENLIGKVKRTPEQLRTWLLKVAVPKLDQTMGSMYETAVEECLRWEPQTPEGTEEAAAPAGYLRFNEAVVRQLALCRA